MAHESEEFYFGYLRRLEDGRVLGRVAFDTTEHARFPEVELGRVGADADVRALRDALADGFAGWIRRYGWSRLPAPRPPELVTPGNVTACLIPARLSRER